MVDTKTSDYAMKFVRNFVVTKGYKRILFKSDNEASVVALKASSLEGTAVEAVMRESPVGDHAANGAAENAVKEMKKQVRAIKSSMEDRYGQRIDERHPVLTWIARHAAETVNRFRIYDDG